MPRGSEQQQQQQQHIFKPDSARENDQIAGGYCESADRESFGSVAEVIFRLFASSSVTPSTPPPIEVL
ncbi:Hypothetical protein CINCED_3A008791 [Cinara cedri]|uniref:Uncharacterized protein n=1 Tax=Cinara cedri TaxID=506608 RepID=A0A5E4LY88_9HEMI|nr:Hypothetical protein CINCED_3A008791 [Cinara cedri]